MKTRLQPSVAALIEVGIMFLPGIPAYIWLWPNVTGTARTIAQMLVYAYFLAGTLFIGLRRWNLNQLGLNRRGWGVSLICGITVVVAMILGRLAINLPPESQPMTIEGLAFDIAYYFGLVGFIEELLFRGLIYRALEELRGTRLAIWGSALAFGVYHVGWQGLLGGLGTAFLGLIDGAIRWRAGGIVGLILIHGLYDTIAVELWPNVGIAQAEQLRVVNSVLAIIVDALLFGTLVYLWKLHPLVERMRNRNKVMAHD
jgi:membrane protease YdiL (CAAX protease family)